MKITDFLNQTWDVDCIGCAMGAGQMLPPGGVIAENDTFTVHQDPEVPIAGFLILAPRQHVRAILDLTPQAYADFSSLLRRSRMALSLLPGIRSVTLIQEERSAHFHFWLFPWYDWMIEKFGSESLTHIRSCMTYARTALNTPQQRQLALEGVARLQASINVRLTEGVETVNRITV